MELQCERIEGFQVVHVTGRIENTTAAIFGQEIGRIVGNGNRQLLLDLAGVSYISSAGLREILVAAKRLKKPGDRCVFCGLSGEVQKIFELSGFITILRVYPTVRDAISHW